MKPNLFKILFLSILFLATGCYEKLDITNDERILVKGTIVDQEGNPLQNISVKTQSIHRSLAAVRSDTSGHFEFVSLNANNDPLNILVNISQEADFETENKDFSSKTYYSEFDNRSLRFDLGRVTLFGVGEFTLILTNLPEDENILNYTISYTSIFCELPYEGSNGSDNCNLNETFNEILGPNSESRQIKNESILGSTAIFEYSLNNEPKQTIEIPITNPPTTYVFEF